MQFTVFGVFEVHGVHICYNNGGISILCVYIYIYWKRDGSVVVESSNSRPSSSCSVCSLDIIPAMPPNTGADFRGGLDDDDGNVSV